jgi:hypothetical protein
MNVKFSNPEIVTLAVYLVGGNQDYVDTEDIAIKVSELAPGRFSWRKYPQQINIEKVRTSLSDAKKPKNGGFLLGKHSQGWLLSEAGLKFSKSRVSDLKNADIARQPLNKKEIAWYRNEKIRMLSTNAFEKANSNKIDNITLQEAEIFFRLDEYIRGQARERKVSRIVTAFSDDPDLGTIIKTLAKKVRKNDRN